MNGFQEGEKASLFSGPELEMELEGLLKSQHREKVFPKSRSSVVSMPGSQPVFSLSKSQVGV